MARFIMGCEVTEVFATGDCLIDAAIGEAGDIDSATVLLKFTTRDEPNYDILMNYRLDLLRKNNLGLNEIQSVIATLEPLDGAIEFVNWLRERFQVVILSDTFYEFANPLMKPLG